MISRIENGKSGQNRTVKKKKAFLAAFRECGVVRIACEIAGVGRSTHYDWLNTDRDYKSDFETAKTEAIESLESEAHLRATTGAMRLKFYRGEPIMVPCREDDPEAIEIQDKPGNFHKPYLEYTKSDSLLMFLLKKLDPSYREGYVPPQQSRDDSMVGLSHDEAVVKKALLTIEKFDISEGAKQELRDQVNSPE